MKINIGDTIRDERGREGVITNIGIATEPTDIAAESDRLTALDDLNQLIEYEEQYEI